MDTIKTNMEELLKRLEGKITPQEFTEWCAENMFKENQSPCPLDDIKELTKVDRQMLYILAGNSIGINLWSQLT
jgi:hypothetical protein